MPTDTAAITDDLVEITYQLESPLITQPTNTTTGRRLIIGFTGQDLEDALQGRSLQVTISGEGFDDTGGGPFFTDTILFTGQGDQTTSVLFTRVDDIRFNVV